MDLAGRLLLAVLFIAGAVQKVTDPGVVMGLLAGFGLPGWLIWPAAAFNAGGAVALVTGWRRYETGLLLAAYCAFTSIFHLIPADPWQMSIFIKNWAIAGGLLVYAGSARGLSGR
jgi:putative oxidoreductase